MSETSKGLLLAVAGGTVFVLGMGALGAAIFLAGRASAPVAPAPIAPAPIASTPGTPSPAPTPAPTPQAAAPAPAAAPTPAPTPAPTAAPPAKPGRTFRQALGLNLEDVALLESPVTFGGGSVGVMDKAPKIVAVSGDTAMAKVGVKSGDRVYQVDGRPVERAADVWNVVDKKTIPGEVRLKIGPTKYDARDVKIEIPE